MHLVNWLCLRWRLTEKEEGWRCTAQVAAGERTKAWDSQSSDREVPAQQKKVHTVRNVLPSIMFSRFSIASLSLPSCPLLEHSDTLAPRGSSVIPVGTIEGPVYVLRTDEWTYAHRPMYVYTYVYTYVSMHVNACIPVYVCQRICVHVCTNQSIRTYVCVNVCMHACQRMYVCMSVNVNVRMSVCVCQSIYVCTCVYPLMVRPHRNMLSRRKRERKKGTTTPHTGAGTLSV